MVKAALAGVLTALAIAFALIAFTIVQAGAAEPPPLSSQYRADVARWTGFYLPDVRPSWVAGQIHQESRWQAGARSRVGALGLMQIMPLTAKDLARNCRLPGFDPLNPRAAIQAGICYDAWLWGFVGKTLPTWARSLEDRWSLSLRGYNGGAGWIVKEAAILRSLELTEGPAVWLGSVCRELRSPASCQENLAYPVQIRRWSQLYVGWD